MNEQGQNNGNQIVPVFPGLSLFLPMLVPVLSMPLLVFFSEFGSMEPTQSGMTLIYISLALSSPNFSKCMVL